MVGTDSRVLFHALAGVYADLGFEGLGDQVFRDLVISRVVEPTSLLDTARVLTDLGHTPCRSRGWRWVLRQLRPLRSATIEINGAIQNLPPAISPHDQALLDTLQKAEPRH